MKTNNHTFAYYIGVGLGHLIEAFAACIVIHVLAVYVVIFPFKELFSAIFGRKDK